MLVLVLLLPFSALSSRDRVPEAGLDPWEVLQGELGKVEWKENFGCLFPAPFCFKWCHLHCDCISFYGTTIVLSWLHWNSMNPLEFHDSDMIHWLYRVPWFWSHHGSTKLSVISIAWLGWDSDSVVILWPHCVSIDPLWFHRSIGNWCLLWRSHDSTSYMANVATC